MSVLNSVLRNFLRALFFFEPVTQPRSVRILCGAILGSCLLVGMSSCSKSAIPADLVIINGAEPESLDPALVTGQAEIRIVSALFEGLTRSHPKTAEAEPALAESWSISSNGAVYLFNLRTNLQWSTGEKITADDVLYSWLRSLNPLTAASYAAQLFYVKNAEEYNSGKITNSTQVGLRVVGPHQFEVTLVQTTPFFLDICALPIAAVVPRKTIENYGDRWLKAHELPTSGAYLLDAWRINNKVRLKKNPRFWEAAAAKNNLVDILPVGMASVAFNLYETGGADIVWDKDLIPFELLETLQKRSDFHTFDYLGNYFFRINTTRFPLNDARVRKALALSINKEHILQKIVKSGGKIAHHLTPDGVKNYQPPRGLHYNPSEAKELLAQAGFPKGKDFPVLQYTFNSAAGGGGANMHEKIAIEMQVMWSEILGIKIELRRLESKVFYAAQNSLDYDLCRSSWIGDYNDPNTFLDIFLSNNGNNRTGWKNAAYDQFLLEANTKVSPAERFQLLRQAEEILVEKELPIVPIYFYTGVNYFDTNKIFGIHNNVIDVHPIHLIGKHDSFARTSR